MKDASIYFFVMCARVCAINFIVNRTYMIITLHMIENYSLPLIPSIYRYPFDWYNCLSLWIFVTFFPKILKIKIRFFFHIIVQKIFFRQSNNSKQMFLLLFLVLYRIRTPRFYLFKRNILPCPLHLKSYFKIRECAFPVHIKFITSCEILYLFIVTSG